MKIYAFILSALLLLTPPACAAPDFLEDPEQFAVYNPDGIKYTFVKHFIMALEYFKDNESLVGGLGVLSVEDLQNEELVGEQMDNLLRANANLRVARNIVGNYTSKGNPLMRKVAEDFTKMCDEQIAINNEERKLWGELIDSVKDIVLGFYDVDKFNARYAGLAEKRKSSLQGLLTASIMAGNILISPKLNEFGHHGFLGISKEERFKLINRLDEGFKGDKYEGEMRAGQTFLEASVASIRGVLKNFRKETLDG